MEPDNPNMEMQRVALLKETLNKILSGVVLPEGGNETLRAIEEMNYASLREFIGTFLVQTDLIKAPNSLWDLIEPALTPGLLQNPVVVGQKDYLSKPLTGSPTKIIGDTGILRPDNPLRLREQELRTQLNSTQNINLSQILGRI